MGHQARVTAGHVWREQPLAVAALGLAAGAAMAAALPPTRVERKAVRPAADALADTAHRTLDGIKQAAGEVSNRLQQDATGLVAEGVKGLARDAAKTFTTSLKGKSENGGSSEQSGSPQ
jgi:hypothetical protein